MTDRSKFRGKAAGLLAGLLAIMLLHAPAQAQSVSSANAAVPPNEASLLKTPAKKLFGSMKAPADLSARAIGTYAKGCLAGGQAIAVNGPAWQVIRTSRNRFYGHPALVGLLERLAADAKAKDGWNGLLVADMAQPRGGPMPSGHASHQIGLDADIWLRPMPDHVMSDSERENIKPISMVKDRKALNRDAWTESHARLIKRAASYAEVERIFVHPPIKAELCKWATGDRSWLAKVRPYYGHDYHFHIRIQCPPGSKTCKPQGTPRPKDGTGCGDELAYWLGDIPWRKAKPNPNAKPPKPAPPLTLAGLPAECRAVVTAP